MICQLRSCLPWYRDVVDVVFWNNNMNYCAEKVRAMGQTRELLEWRPSYTDIMIAVQLWLLDKKY